MKRTLHDTSGYFLVFFFLFCSSILRGGEATDLPYQKSPLRDSITQTIQNKSVLEILGFANQYSYSDMPKALLYADIALEVAKKTGNKEEQFSAQRDIGFIYEDNALLDKAIVAYEMAAMTARDLHDTLKTTIYNDLAIVSRKIGNFKASYSYYDKVLDLAEKTTPVDYFMLDRKSVV